MAVHEIGAPKICAPRNAASGNLVVAANTANLSTKILDSRGFDSSRILVLRGGILMTIGNSWKFESRNLSRDNLSREIGRRSKAAQEAPSTWMRTLRSGIS